MTDIVVSERCGGCPQTACPPSLAPSGFKCVRKRMEQYFDAHTLMGSEKLIEAPKFHGLVGPVPEQSRPAQPDPSEEIFRRNMDWYTNQGHEWQLNEWQQKYLTDAYRRLHMLQNSAEDKRSISGYVRTRLNKLCEERPYIGKAWAAFTAGDVELTGVHDPDEVVKRWMASVLTVDSAVERAGESKVAKLRSIYGMLHHAAKELLDEFPTAMTRDDVASLRDVIDELEAMVHDVEQLLNEQ
jgi:hypothetical protein